MLKPNNQGVYLPPRDDKWPKLDLDDRGDDITYPKLLIKRLLRTPSMKDVGTDAAI